MADELSSIEALARAIHEDSCKATISVTGTHREFNIDDTDEYIENPTFDQLDEEWKNVIREQARLMLERIMR